MSTRTRTICLVSLIVVIAFIAMGLLFCAQPSAPPNPAAMTRFTAGDRSLSIDHPSNWEAHLRSEEGVQTEVEFRPGACAFMKIEVNLQRSLIVDVLKSTDSENTGIAGMVPGGEALKPREYTPSAHLHSVQAAHLANQLSEFSGFRDGATEKARIGGQEALVTTCFWNAPGLLGSRNMAGRRVTLLSGDHQVSIVYGCLKEIQQTVLPVFDRMLISLDFDVAAGAQ